MSRTHRKHQQKLLSKRAKNGEEDEVKRPLKMKPLDQTRKNIRIKLQQEWATA